MPMQNTPTKQKVISPAAPLPITLEIRDSTYTTRKERPIVEYKMIRLIRVVLPGIILRGFSAVLKTGNIEEIKTPTEESKKGIKKQMLQLLEYEIKVIDQQKVQPKRIQRLKQHSPEMEIQICQG